MKMTNQKPINGGFRDQQNLRQTLNTVKAYSRIQSVGDVFISGVGSGEWSVSKSLRSFGYRGRCL